MTHRYFKLKNILVGTMTCATFTYGLFLSFFIVVGFIALALLHLIVVSIKPAACCLLLPFLQEVIEFTIITIFRCLTRLSSLLATMDANRLSPASSEIRNRYSGALT